MLLSPIPHYLLGSDCTVRVPADGEYGGEFAEPAGVAGVRLVPRAEMERSGYVFTDGESKGLLFVDAEASEGAFRFPVGSLVSVDGGPEMAVVKNSPIPGYWGEVHHWEVELA